MLRPTDTATIPLGNPAAAIGQVETEPQARAPASLLELAAPRPGETVVDLGCRRLADGFRAMRRVGAAGRVRGIVERRTDLEHATALRDRWVFADLAYQCAPLAAVPLDDEVADVVLLNDGLEHADEPLHILGEACRLVGPEGRLAVGIGSTTADRLRSLLEVMGLEIRTVRDLGPDRTVILATKP